MRRTIGWAVLGIALCIGLLPASSSRADDLPVGVVSFDSGTRVVREVAEALTGSGRSILEAYPAGSELFLGLVSLLPEDARIAAIEWGMSLSLGHDPARAAEVSVDALAAWCVAQYPGSRRYPVIVLGSPNGAVAHLAALLGAPFLTTSFGLAFRHPTTAPDDLDAYRETCGAAAERIVINNVGTAFEVVCHYDPIHDRSMVRVADFARVKLLDLPACYRTFLRDRLASDGTLVLVDCTYSWPQIALGERLFLQIGGLGAIEPSEYLERWEIDAPTEMRRESEWGCPRPFSDGVATYAEDCSVRLLRISLDHPSKYSLLAYAAYLACGGSRAETVLIDSFNHQNPRTNLETGIPGFWLPFNTADGLDLVACALGERTLDTVYFAPLPSFARSPDIVPLETWDELLSSHDTLEWIGANPERYPADPLAPYRFVEDLASLRDALGRSVLLRLPVETLAGLLARTP